MKVSQLLPSVRAEVEKPFEEKLARAKQLIRTYANKNASVSCSFGKDSTIVLYLSLELNPKIPVVFCNTGVEFKETLDFRDKLVSEFGLNFIELKPEKTYFQVWDGFKPHDGSKTTPGRAMDRCCYYLKEKPFKLCVRKYDFAQNFTGLTAMESRQRMLRACEKGMEYYHKTHNCWKIHPLLYWTPEEVWEFTKENCLPINQAYAKYGLDRIGCVPCTAYKGWREQLARVNFRMYKLISERYFHQRLLEVANQK